MKNTKNVKDSKTKKILLLSSKNKNLKWTIIHTSA